MSMGQFTIGSVPYISGLSGVAFIFETMNFDPAGHPADQLVDQEEELKDVGVDRARFRLIHQQFPEFSMVTTENFSNYNIAAASQQRYFQASRKTGILSTTLVTYGWKWKDVKVIRVVPRLYSGSIVGNGVGASLAVIVAEWVLRLTKDWGHA